MKCMETMNHQIHTDSMGQLNTIQSRCCSSGTHERFVFCWKFSLGSSTQYKLVPLNVSLTKWDGRRKPHVSANKCHSELSIGAKGISRQLKVSEGAGWEVHLCHQWKVTVKSKLTEGGSMVSIICFYEQITWKPLMGITYMVLRSTA